MSKKEKEEIVDIEDEKDLKTKKIILVIIIVFFTVSICFTSFLINKRIDKAKPDNIVNDSMTYNSAYKIKDNSLDSFDLYFLKMENSRKNKVYSPLSLKYTLGMLAQATDGSSKGQIEAILGDYISKKYKDSDHLFLANAVFVRDSLSDNIRNEYTLNIKDRYGAEVKYDSFNNADNINKWISDKTFNLINNFVSNDEIQSLDYELVNALAIDMAWNKKIQAVSYKDAYKVNYKHEDYGHYIPSLDTSEMKTIKFDENQDVKVLTIGASANRYDIVTDIGEDEIKAKVTEEFKKYRATNGDECLTEQQLKDFDGYLDNYIKELHNNYDRIKSSTDFYFSDNDDEIIFAKDLREYDGTTLQYVGIMPKYYSLSEYINTFSSKEIKEKISNLKDLTVDSFKDGVITQIDGSIPIFNYDYKLNLKQDLKNMGIVDVFDKEKANLSGMLKNADGAYISSAGHKATIDFSNEGIKAAAVTAIGGVGSATCGFDYFFEVPVEKIDLTFDKPYMYLIIEKDTKEVWFAGTVYEPTK